MDGVLACFVVIVICEERLMTEIAYPDLDDHKEEHDRLIRTLRTITHRPYDALKVEGVVTWFKNWILTHLAVSDDALGKFVTYAHLLRN